MRRSVLLLTAMVVAIVLASGVALAKAITCPNRDDGFSCVGTKKADTITGTEDADDILARGGGDKIFALGGNDQIAAGRGADASDGGAGNDRYLFGARWGKDTVAADASGQDRVRFLQSVTGSVRIALDDQHASIPRGASSGKNKVVFAGNFFENAGGGSGSDTIAGTSSNNKLGGHEGNDSLDGGAGSDSLEGGEGDDTLNGGDDDDTYRGSEGEDVIDDASGTDDSLDLGDHSSSDAVLDPLDGSDAGNEYEDLSIDLGGGDVVVIENYFDNSAPKVLDSSAGTGLIENIRFSDETFDFGAVHDLIGLREKDPVVANANGATTGEDTAVVIDVLANDSGPNLSVKAASLADPAHGTATLITDAGPDQGKVRYEPDPDYNNTSQSADTFTYEACDDVAPVLCDEATVSVTVNPVNDKPSFTSEGDQSVAEDAGRQTVTGWATFDPGPANESGQQVADYLVTDENGDPLNSTLFTQAGQPDVSNSGTLSYTPAQDAHGSITVKAAVKDNGGTASGGVDTSDAQTFTISITSENDLPTISSIADQTIDEDSDTGALGFTIGDVESDVSTFTPTGSSSDTTLVPNANIVFGGSGANRTVTVTPAQHEFGTATIEVKVEDSNSDSSTETFQLTVSSVNDPPEANDDTKTTEENTPLVFPASDLVGNDSRGAANESGQTLTVTEVSSPLNGTVVLDSGEITFTPDTDYTGPASFEYTICDNGTPQECSTQTATVNVTVSRVNSKPVAQDGTAAMDEDAAPIQIDLGPLVSDTETSDANLTYTIVGSNPTAQQGTLTTTSTPGLYSFDSAENFNGTVEISYKVTDRGDPDNCGAPGPSCEAPQESDVKTVTITVNSVVDPPVISSDGTLSYTEDDPPIPVDGGLSVTHPEGTQITEATVEITDSYQDGQDVLAFTDNDPGDDISLDPGSTGEMLTLTGADSAANYQAALRSVTYENTSQSPATVTRTVTFLATDADSVTSDPATRSISVTAVDDPPVAVNDSATVQEDAAATAVPVLTNDTDVDGGPKTISSASDPANGTVVLTGGSPGAHTGLTYQPDPNYCNDPPGTTPDTFDYTLNGGSQGTVSMTVTCVNDAPLADDEAFNGNDGAIGNTAMIVNDPDDGAPSPTHPKTTVTGDILAGDTDIDGPGPLTVTPGTFATNDGGSVTIESDGDFTFHPAASTSCTDTSDFFDYTVEDSGSPELTDTGRVTVAISGCVWYVSNDASGNSGTSAAPFDTLAQAETASANNHTVFVLDGDNTSTGYGGDGYQMNSGERLIGEHEGLVVDPDQGGGLTADTLHPANAGAHPTLTATSADVVSLDDANQVRGVELDPQGTGGGVAGATGDTGGAAIDDVRILDNGTVATQPALELDSTSGIFDVSNLTIDNEATGVRLNNAGTVNFAPTGTISIASNGARGLDATGTNMGTGSVFDDILVTGSGGGAVSMVNTSGATTFGDGSGIDLALSTASSTTPAFRLSSAGTVTVGTAGTDNVTAAGGPAIDVTGTSGASLAFDDVDSTNSASDGINLEGLGSGTFGATSGDIGGAVGIAFDLDGGSGNVTYPGDLDNGSGATAEITGRSGGAVTLSGPINDTNDAGGGITVNSNTGGSTAFTNAVKTLNTGASDALVFNNSDGHTLTLSGGGLDIDTTSGKGFEADTSGTLNVTDSGNTIDTTTGRALNVTNTDIGSSDLTFQSISANGAANGILLNNTGSSGGLTVTGNGGTCTIAAPTCTGGTIQNTTANGISLTSTNDPSFASLRIKDTAGHGISGTTTSRLALSNSLVQGAGDADNEAGLFFANVDGTNLTGNSSITNTVVHAPADVGAFIQNYGGSLNLTVSGSTFSGTQKNTPGVVTGDDLLRMISDRTNAGSATITARITGSTFRNSESDDILANAQSSTGSGGGTMNLTVDNNTFDGNGVFETCETIGCNSYAIVTQGTQGSTIRYTIQNNDIVNHLDAGVAARSDNNSNVQGVIKNNTIGRAGSPRSGSYRDRGIFLASDDSSDFVASVENNVIHSTFFEGISASTTDGTGLSPKMDLTILGNTTPTPADSGGTYLPSIGMTASGNASACARTENNTAQPGRSGAGSIDFLLFRDTATSTATFQLEGLSAPTADASSFVKSKNPASADPVIAVAGKDSSNPSTPQFTGGTCRTPAATPTP